MRQALRPGCAMRRHYLTIGDRQVHYRRAGSGPALLALHASPLSSASLDGLLGTLADRFTVIAPDREGYGQSDPLPQAEPDVNDYARAAVEVAGALGLERFFLFGTHTGSKVALHAATLAPGRVAHVVLDGLGAYSPQERADQLAHYTPAVEPVWHGGHLLAAWHQVRNMSLFWPWFRQERGRRLDDDVPDPEVLQAWVLDLLRASPDYGLAYRAAFRYDPLPALQRLAVPATLATRAGDPLHGHRDRLPAGAARQVTIGAGGDHPELGDLLREALTDALPDAPPVPGTTPRRPTTRQYVDTAHGQVHVRSTGAPGARTLLALHASPGSAEDLDARIALLAGPDGHRARYPRQRLLRPPAGRRATRHHLLRGRRAGGPRRAGAGPRRRVPHPHRRVHRGGAGALLAPTGQGGRPGGPARPRPGRARGTARRLHAVARARPARDPPGPGLAPHPRHDAVLAVVQRPPRRHPRRRAAAPRAAARQGPGAAQERRHLPPGLPRRVPLPRPRADRPSSACPRCWRRARWTPCMRTPSGWRGSPAPSRASPSCPPRTRREPRNARCARSWPFSTRPNAKDR